MSSYLWPPDSSGSHEAYISFERVSNPYIMLKLAKCICRETYLCKPQNVFVQIVKCICTDFKTSKYICPCTVHKVCLFYCLLPPSSKGFVGLTGEEELSEDELQFHTTLLLKVPFTFLHIFAKYHIIWHTCFHDSTMHIFALCKHFWNAPLEVHLQSVHGTYLYEF